MPSSYPANIPYVLAACEMLKPKRVLDVGVGYGKYGFLLRERVDDFRWEMTLDGVEIFPDYLLRSNAEYLYDSIWIGNFLDFAAPSELYDLTLFIDVLEHFNHVNARRALDKALVLSHNVLICVPIGYEQGPVYGNEHERHRSEWPPQEILDYSREATPRLGMEMAVQRFASGTEDSELYLLSVSHIRSFDEQAHE